MNKVQNGSTCPGDGPEQWRQLLYFVLFFEPSSLLCPLLPVYTMQSLANRLAPLTRVACRSAHLSLNDVSALSVRSARLGNAIMPYPRGFLHTGININRYLIIWQVGLFEPVDRLIQALFPSHK